jgi:outer membrane protein TolC/ABC-type transporter Mla MlaB component
MLRITAENKKGKTLLRLEGKISGPHVGALEQCWRELLAASPKQKFSVDLCGVSYIDSAGKALLREMHRLGAALLAVGCLNQAIVDEITQAQQSGERSAKRAKGTPIIFYAIFFALLGVSSGARAQQGATPMGTMRMTLDQAVTLAIKQNPTQQIGLITAAEAVQDTNISRAALLPQADLKVSDALQRQNLQALFGGKPLFNVPGVPLKLPGHIGPYQIFQAGPSFGTPIFDFSLWKRYKVARSNQDAAKAGSDSTREQVILLVVSQYIGGLRAQADVEASRSRVDLAQALYDQAADLQKEGVGTGIDTLRANVELQNEKQRLIEAENSRDSELFGLSKILNLNPLQKVELADSLSFFETPQPEVEPSIDAAMANRPEWKQIEAQEKALKYDKQASEYTRLPSFRADGNWAYLGTRPNNGIPTYTYTASMDVPLWTSGRIRAEVARADLELHRVDQQKADLRNQIGLDVKTALLDLQSARNEVQVANLGVQLAKEEVDQARDRFRAGVANNIEVIQAQDSLSRANDNQIAALYRFNQSRAEFARAIGQMERTYAR